MNDAVDPEDLPSNYTPAVVQLASEGPVFVADYYTLSSGWLAVRQWDGERVKLPPHRVGSISEVRVQSYGTDRDRLKRRVADSQRREMAESDDTAGMVVPNAAAATPSTSETQA
ncbi:hypothetical protein [Haloarcula pellucida]|uniref:Uncharacterized protein n=1 Tax=Haloarcula pellucida TaxID=1427151 RepID=A0A830GLZ9_9EURY|nr:hypothetical protein [Halomicroarcula pellucida]MBX0348227.1 hypothetical protein [Halomicroarcula pellucida]GGN97587.1 hypothetical protein GCM10009030_26970 [Halomicroarcula pellucida]